MTIIESPTADYALEAISYKKSSVSMPGGSYVVTVDEAGYHCQCKGYEYRRTCRHITEVRAGKYDAKPRLHLKPLPTVAAAPAPSGNPSAWLWEA